MEVWVNGSIGASPKAGVAPKTLNRKIAARVMLGSRVARYCGPLILRPEMVNS